MNKVIDTGNSLHYIWGNGSSGWVFADQDALSVKQEQMPPGASEVLHVHERANQFFYVLAGTATFYIEGQKLAVGKHQGILIEQMQQHFIANETEELLDF